MSSNIATLASLYTEITRLLDGEDVTVSELSTDSLSRLLVVAQKRIYRDVRCRFNEKDFDTVTVTSNLAPLPSDYKSLSIAHFGSQSLIPVPEEVIRDYQSGTAGTEKYIAHAGANFTFWPAVADATELQGRYYFAWPDLSDSGTNIADNLLFQEADDLFIYAALVECAPFFGEMQKMPVWEQKYASIVGDLNRESRRVTYSGGRLQRRPSARICERR